MTEEMSTSVKEVEVKLEKRDENGKLIEVIVIRYGPDGEVIERKDTDATN